MSYLSTELFSVPTLRMSPAEVFQKDTITLTCRSESYASERINESELTYTLNPPEAFMSSLGNGVFYGKALQHEFNYSCVAQAKGIVKHSEVLTVRPKGNPTTLTIGRFSSCYMEALVMLPARHFCLALLHRCQWGQPWGRQLGATLH